MKTLITLITLCTFILNISAQQTQENFSLSINFEAAKEKGGYIMIALYDSEENHMKKPFKTTKAEFVDGKAKIQLKGIPKGEYSFSYYHDENSNAKLDKNMVGIPKEPYGFSNDEEGMFGPPDFSECKITIDQSMNLNITVN